jgi:hypothetical protein
MSDRTRREVEMRADALDIEYDDSVSTPDLVRAIEEKEEEFAPAPRFPTGVWIKDHLLSISLTVLFLVSLVGQFYFQFRHEVDAARTHGVEAPTALSPEFLDAFLASVLENWQSEFLQVVTFVVLATYFIHRGSPQSRDGADEMAEDIKAIRRKLGA